AKRQYWIEWECTLDKFPTKTQLDQLNEKLRNYISEYLDKLARYKYEVISKQEAEFRKSIEGTASAGIFKENELEILEAFKGLIVPKDLRSEKEAEENDDKLAIEYSQLENGEWVNLNLKRYANAAVKNIAVEAPGEKKILKFTVYTKKWMEIFKHRWRRVSDSHLVFSYRGWFVTKNRIRLTSEGRGTVTPPDPPPPPK
ncbi:MAG TPA: hypothetical protein VEV87_04155, partial [Chitinophagaceae bacterium]|nr:hypothetical protein [Chitinophagaceae bacterium]